MEEHIQNGLPDAGRHGSHHLFRMAFFPGAFLEIPYQHKRLRQLAGHLQYVHHDDLCDAAGVRHFWNQGLSGGAFLQDHVHGPGVSDPYAAGDEASDSGEQDNSQRAVDAARADFGLSFPVYPGVFHGVGSGAGVVCAG